MQRHSRAAASQDTTLVGIYELNLALLVTHEIDAAFWHEWDLFRIPGGIQLFLLLNFALVLLFILGLRAVLLERRSSAGFSIALAVAGILTFVLHVSFLIAGSRAFASPASLLLLLAIGVTSFAQLILAVKYFRRRSAMAA